MVGFTLCALCCAAPILGAFGLGSVFLSALAGSLELAGMVLMFTGAAWWVLQMVQRARSTSGSCGTSCAVDCGCRTGAG